MVAGDQLLLGLRKVEGRAIGLGDARRQVDVEAHRLQEDEPAWNHAKPGARLTVDDLGQRERVAQEDHARERQAIRQLVADHLGRRPQAAEQRVLVVRAPAGQHYPIHAHRGDREHHQHGNVDVGDLKTKGLVQQPEQLRLGSKGHDRKRGEGGRRRNHRRQGEQPAPKRAAVRIEPAHGMAHRLQDARRVLLVVRSRPEDGSYDKNAGSGAVTGTHRCGPGCSGPAAGTRRARAGPCRRGCGGAPARCACPRPGPPRISSLPPVSIFNSRGAGSAGS